MNAPFNPPHTFRGFDRASVIPSLKRTLVSLPVTQQIEILLDTVRAKDFHGFDGDELDRVECALSSLLSEARENAYLEDRALHGGEVLA